MLFSKAEVNERLVMLEEACNLEDDDKAKAVRRKAVPIFGRLEEINNML